jgi:hypothetical protein
MSAVGTSGTMRRGLRVCADLVSGAGVLVGLFMVGSALATPAPPTAPPTATATQSAPATASAVTPIPIPEIAQRAAQVTTLLRSGQAPDSSESDDANLGLTDAADWIRKRHVSTTEALASSPSVNALANLTDSWCSAEGPFRIRPA